MGVGHAAMSNLSTIAPLATTAAITAACPAAGPGAHALGTFLSRLIGGVGEDMYRQANNVPVASAEDKTAREKALKHLLYQKPQEDTNPDGSPVGGVGMGHRKYKLDKHQKGLESITGNVVDRMMYPWQQQAQTQDKTTSFPSTVNRRDAGFCTTGSVGKATYSVPTTTTPAGTTFNYLPLPSFKRGASAAITNNAGILGGKVKKTKSNNLHSHDANRKAILRAFG
jgi:hypothetical protein